MGVIFLRPWRSNTVIKVTGVASHRQWGIEEYQFLSDGIVTKILFGFSYNTQEWYDIFPNLLNGKVIIEIPFKDLLCNLDKEHKIIPWTEYSYKNYMPFIT